MVVYLEAHLISHHAHRLGAGMVEMGAPDSSTTSPYRQTPGSAIVGASAASASRPALAHKGSLLDPLDFPCVASFCSLAPIPAISNSSEQHAACVTVIVPLSSLQFNPSAVHPPLILDR